MIPLAVVVVFLWTLIVASVRWIKIRLLLIALPVVALSAPVASCIVKTVLIPVESAEVAVPNSDTTIKLEFYRVLDWSNNSGRYLVLRNGVGEVRQNMSAFDWVHWPRTSIYLISDGRIAVLGPTYDDYVLDARRLTIESLRAGTPSDTWTYFGAFDFNHNKLTFIPASDQRECTDTRGENYAWETRPQGRADRCRQEDLRY
jgi:hypothetical protein